MLPSTARSPALSRQANDAPPVSSGVTTTGPSTIPKSDRFTSRCSAGSCHSTIAVVPPISPPAPITTAIRARAERRVPETGTFGPTTAVALAKRNEPPSSNSRTVGGY